MYVYDGQPKSLSYVLFKMEMNSANHWNRSSNFWGLNGVFDTTWFYIFRDNIIFYILSI